MDRIQKINREFYDQRASRWSANHTNSFWHEMPFRRFLRLLPANAKVIDIGCANGIHLPLFLGIGRKLKYEGLDISTAFLKIAKARYPQFTFHKGNILEAKTLPKKKYDAFWAGAILQHIPLKDWNTVLFNISKMLKPNGIGYITVPEERPNPASKEDQRYFELFDDTKFKMTIGARGWKVIAQGELQGQTGRALWRWYIVGVK